MKIALIILGFILGLVLAVIFAVISPVLFPYLAYCEHLKYKHGEIKEKDKNIFQSVNKWAQTLKSAV